jgi:hypothetical protein
MHSKLLELMGSITMTSVRPPPSAFSKQCDKPCTDRSRQQIVSVCHQAGTAQTTSQPLLPTVQRSEALQSILQTQRRPPTTQQYTLGSRSSPAFATTRCLRDCSDVCSVR